MAPDRDSTRASGPRTRGPLRGSVRGALRRHAPVRDALRRMRTRARSLHYRWLSRRAVDPDLVVFESLGGRACAGSPRAVYEAMLADARYANSRFVWALRHPERAAALPVLQDPRTEVVRFRSPAYYDAFARAGVWVSNATLLPELVPRGQLYVQTWHGIGIKKIGYDLPGTAVGTLDAKSEIEQRYRLEAGKIGVFVSAAPFGTEVFAGAFGLPASGPGSPFVELGTPSNDALATATPGRVAAARAGLGLADGVRAVLYAPTFRDDRHDPRTGYLAELPIDPQALATALGPGHALLLRRHYLVEQRVESGDAFRDVSTVDDPNDLLLASDVLVTDYSSLCSQYVLLDRPMVFVVQDADRYARLRGFYFPVEELPGPLVRTQEQLVAALLDPTLGERYAERRRAFRERMCPHDDGRVSARVVDLLAARRDEQDAAVGRSRAGARRARSAAAAS